MTIPHDVSIVIDCLAPEPLAQFWAEALGFEVKGTMEQYAMVAPKPDMPGPRILLQGVAERRSGKNRMHLDLHTTDLDVEVERVLALGARKLEDAPRSLGRSRWQVMADPEGNEFCIVTGT
jgi:predicted enzyme related to lactoylglutathione lyase